MDIKIKNKDIAVDISDNIIQVSGIEQVIQQINLAMKVKKGCFVYDRNFGCEIHNADFSKESVVKEIEGLINESLVSVNGVSVSVNKVNKVEDIISVYMTVDYNYEKRDVEVIING